MSNVRIADTTRDAMMDEFDNQCNAGTAATIKIYDGSQPANSDVALTGQNLLAELLASAVMWGVSSNGVLTLAAVADDTSADFTGTATWARIETQSSGGVTVFDCDVGTSGTTIILNTVSIVSGGTVSITSGSMTFGDS